MNVSDTEKAGAQPDCHPEEIDAPFVAKKPSRGSFHPAVDEKGERIPLTVADLTGKRVQSPSSSRFVAPPQKN